MKNSSEELVSRLGTAENRISVLKYRSKKVSKFKQQKSKLNEREQSLQDLWDNIKWSNTSIWSPRRSKNLAEDLLTAIIAKLFAKLILIQKLTVIFMMKLDTDSSQSNCGKPKKKTVKTSKEKKKKHYMQWNNMKSTADFLPEMIEPGCWNGILLVLENKYHAPSFLYLNGISFQNKAKIKT